MEATMEKICTSDEEIDRTISEDGEILSEIPLSVQTSYI